MGPRHQRRPLSYRPGVRHHHRYANIVRPPCNPIQSLPPSLPPPPLLAHLLNHPHPPMLQDAQARSREEREGVDEVFDAESRKRAKKEKGKGNKPHKAFKF